MSDALTVLAYNVGFGDALLVTVPERQGPRHILIDVGNIIAGEGSGDDLLLAAVDDIIERTGGRVDLYVMTHEHLDHVQGLRYAAARGRTLRADTVWMTASAAPDYYERHPAARRRRLALTEAVAGVDAILGLDALPAGMETVHALNAAPSTADYVDHIRHLGRQTHYVHRGTDVSTLHPLREAQLRVLAPEEDTSVYYGRVRAHLGPAPAGAPLSPVTAGSAEAPVLPPRGVDGGAFYELIDRMDRGLWESLLSIDRASNNTSVVLELTWRGRRLLFTGDAELESWRIMAELDLLHPVDLVKVSHHGSRTGRPPAGALDLILPESRRRQAVAILCTHGTERWKGVPDPDAIAELEARTSRLYRTDDPGVAGGAPVAITLPPAD